MNSSVIVKRSIEIKEIVQLFVASEIAPKTITPKQQQNKYLKIKEKNKPILHSSFMM